MNNQEAVEFLFTMAMEIKRSLESPVILLTMADYADGIFNSLVEMRAALVQQAAAERVADIVAGFHRDWLQAVSDVDDFKRRIRETPRDYISRAIEFTSGCVRKRHHYFRHYVDTQAPSMTDKENGFLQDDLRVMEDMHKNIDAVLRDKQISFQTLSDLTEYYNKVYDEAEELLNWLDGLTDNLAIQYSKVVGFKFPELTTDLSKTLQQVVDEVSSSADPEAQLLTRELVRKSRNLSCIMNLGTENDVEVRKVLEKIKHLEDRIDRLKTEHSSAVMALQHKTIYLEERLLSLENLKMSLYTLKNKQKQQPHSERPFHIFDHLLPPEERCRLVDDLMKLWTDAICGMQESKSIISILSVVDIKEIFSDNLGKFTVDKYGRKLYKGEQGSLYQVNETNELVPIKDEEKRVYFYDDCGRYYINEHKQRIYKAYDNASEYQINREGRMMKLKEIRNGVEYWYDNLGRYYYDDNGRRVYCKDGVQFEHDGLGNLVRKRSLDRYAPYGEYAEVPREPVVMEESKYLQCAVGLALRTCLAEVVLRQPADPVLALAHALERFRRAQMAAAARCAAGAALRAERARAAAEAAAAAAEDAAYEASTAAASICSEEGDVSYADPNFMNYQSAPDSR